MDAIRITDLQLVNEYQPRDKMALQRFEAGVWNDYYTELGDYLGQYTTRVYEWNMSLLLGEYISPVTPGNYLVLLGAHFTYLPGGLFTSNPVQITISAGGDWVYSAEFTHNGSGQGALFNPAQGSGPSLNIYGSVNSDLIVSSGGTGSGSPNQGTVRIQLQYVEFTPL